MFTEITIESVSSAVRASLKAGMECFTCPRTGLAYHIAPCIPRVLRGDNSGIRSHSFGLEYPLHVKGVGRKQNGKIVVDYVVCNLETGEDYKRYVGPDACKEAHDDVKALASIFTPGVVAGIRKLEAGRRMIKEA